MKHTTHTTHRSERTPDGGFVERDGVRVRYRRRGTGPIVVLLSGYAASSRCFDALAERIEGERTVVAIDNRGAGASDVPRGEYTVEELAEDARAVLEHLSLGSAVLVGHSMGGFIALRLALTHRELVSRLVLLSTAALGYAGASERARRALFRTSGSAREIIAGILDVGLGSRTRGAGGKARARFEADLLAAPPRGRGVAGQRAAISRFDMRDELHLVAPPAVVVHGDEDEIIPLTRAGELALNLPDARLMTLPGVGHFPMAEALDEVASIVLGPPR
jgi:3-oxoadipate enol-lactonase